MNISDLRQKADSGNVAAQAILGNCYLEGDGVEVNYREAFRLLSAAASQRAPRAISGLARMYAEGLGTSKDPTQALSLYESAAKSGEFLSQIELGRIYSRGIGVQSDPDKALKWYSAATAQASRVQDCEELREARDYVARAASLDENRRPD